MSLRAKKPIVQQARFQAVIYANRGVGKTHFCCSFPNSYYIDTENVSKYPHFVKMLVDNNSDLIQLNDLGEVIKEVSALLQAKHNYKTLIIDSITFPIHHLANMEAERLIKSSKKETIEGTEFGANLAKAKRLTFELGILLSRLDMNVIVVAHEKTKYEKGIEIGKSSDVNEKMEYALGTVINLQRRGAKLVAVVEKSRYSELKTFESLDFENGYEMIKERFGAKVFELDCIPEELANVEQLNEFSRLTMLLNVSDETVQKWIINSRASNIKQVSKENMTKLITFLLSKVKGNTDEN